MQGALGLKIPNTDVNKIENLWFDVIKGKQHFIVGGLYRHPNQFIKNFSDSIESTLNQISSKNIPCILAGDFNINLLNHETHQGTSDNLNTMLLNNFLPMLLSPTRINRISSTLIDQIYFFQGKLDVMIHSGTLSVEVADHLPNYVLIVQPKGENLQKSRPNIRLFTIKNKNKFGKEINNIDWISKFGAIDDPNLLYDIFINEI